VPSSKGSLASSDAFESDDSPLPPSSNEDRSTRRTDFPDLPVLSPVLDGRIRSTADANSNGKPANGEIVRIEFQIEYVTAYGENVMAVGDCKELGSWDLTRAVPLKVHRLERDREKKRERDGKIDRKRRER
jgi:hypothetical protein